MKVAVSSGCRKDIEYFKSVILDRFFILDNEETEKEGLATGVYTVERKRDQEFIEVADIFRILELITGVDCRKKGKQRHAVRARNAVCYLLRERLEFSHEKIALLLGYKSHASSLLVCKRLGHLAIKGANLEVAVRKVLNELKF